MGAYGPSDIYHTSRWLRGAHSEYCRARWKKGEQDKKEHAAPRTVMVDKTSRVGASCASSQDRLVGPRLCCRVTVPDGLEDTDKPEATSLHVDPQAWTPNVLSDDEQLYDVDLRNHSVLQAKRLTSFAERGRRHRQKKNGHRSNVHASRCNVAR